MLNSFVNISLTDCLKVAIAMFSSSLSIILFKFALFLPMWNDKGKTAAAGQQKPIPCYCEPIAPVVA